MLTRSTFAILLALLPATACSELTNPDPVDVSVRPVHFRNQEEYEAWPSTPTISGGAAIRVRGIALAGCGQLVGSATRRGETVSVEITATKGENPCVASIWAWQPYVATVRLDPGDYRVNVRSAGHEGIARFAATVLEP